jgi:hypothetical protein
MKIMIMQATYHERNNMDYLKNKSRLRQCMRADRRVRNDVAELCDRKTCAAEVVETRAASNCGVDGDGNVIFVGNSVIDDGAVLEIRREAGIRRDPMTAVRREWRETGCLPENRQLGACIRRGIREEVCIFYWPWI